MKRPLTVLVIFFGVLFADGNHASEDDPFFTEDACALQGFNNTWVFVSGLTNLEVVVNVTDTVTGQVRIYGSPFGIPFEPALATAAFATCGE